MVRRYSRSGLPYDDGVDMSQELIDDIIERTRTVVAFTSLNMPRDGHPPAAPAPEAEAGAEPQPEEPPRPGTPRTQP